MRSILTALPFAAITFFCWGIYGPVLHHGRNPMGSVRQLICVGAAYFIIAVIAPILLLKTYGEKGNWSIGGTIWSLAAGSCGAFGALGIILSFNFDGSPIYVMPLVFGSAPVVNTLVSMWMTGTFREAGKVFIGGIALVAIGAAGVMYLGQESKGGANFWTMLANPETTANAILVLASVSLTGLCWGSYGSVLHKGTAKLGGSRLRALLCVGLAYFVIAVIAPFGMIGSGIQSEQQWTTSGIAWSMAAGAAGAFGALGIILAFTVGGKPIFVMPIVFGMAPVVNTLVTMVESGSYNKIHPLFFVSLAVVIGGAITVLTFAPKPHPPGKSPAGKSDAGKKPAKPHGENGVSDQGQSAGAEQAATEK